MGHLLVQILPIAVLIALEPVCVIAAMIMPATERPAANGFAYLGALIGVMLGYGVAVLLVFHRHANAGGAHTDDIVQLLWLLIGLGFLAAFAVILIRRPPAGGARHESRWMGWVERMGPLGAGALGLFLVNWEMETPALTEIVKAHVSLAAAFGALLVFVAVAVSTAVAPIAAYQAAPARVGGLLSIGKGWLSRHERILALVLFGLVGAAYTYKGAAALLQR